MNYVEQANSERKWVSYQGLRRRERWNLLPNGYSFCLGWWKIFQVGSGDGHTAFWMYLMLLSCTLNNGQKELYIYSLSKLKGKKKSSFYPICIQLLVTPQLLGLIGDSLIKHSHFHTSTPPFLFLDRALNWKRCPKSLRSHVINRVEV